MKIQGPGYTGQIRPERGGAPTPAGPAQGVRKPGKAANDQVEISPAALEMQRLREAIEAAPEIRPEAVRRLREAIEQGRYQPDDAAIARRLIEEFLG